MDSRAARTAAAHPRARMKRTEDPVSTNPTWTPAPRPGIIPLHPLTFGAILGRSFAALRHNPRVLLGFALGVQGLVYLLLIVGVAGIAFLSFSRLDTLQPGTDDFDAVTAGSTLITALSGLVLGLLAMAMQIVVQAVVVGEVAHAVLAEKLTLGALWRRVRPALGRLIGYAALVFVAIALLVTAVGAAIVFVGTVVAPALAVVLTILAFLAAIPLYLWLSTKLLLVPSTLILEGARIRGAVARSWRLVRGRFWPALGIIVVIGLLFGTISQVVSVPFSLLGGGLTTVFSPTGEPTTGAIVGLVITLGLTYVVTLLIQAVAVVVQATASVLIYIDCRMRHEGLDIDLLGYVEARDAGATHLPDPWTAHVGRPAPPRAAAPTAPGRPSPAYAGPPAPPAMPAPPRPPMPPAPSPGPVERPARSATDWAAPGAEVDGADRSP